MLESMEELADAIEDAQYVNAIATQDDGPKPVVPWEQPTSSELLLWEEKQITLAAAAAAAAAAVAQSRRRRPRSSSISVSSQFEHREAFSMEWMCQQPIGFYLFSEYIKRHHHQHSNTNSSSSHIQNQNYNTSSNHHDDTDNKNNPYLQINFIEEIIRFRKLQPPPSPSQGQLPQLLESTTTMRQQQDHNAERFFHAIQILQQFFGYSQTPEPVVTAPIQRPADTTAATIHETTIDTRTTSSSTDNDPSPQQHVMKTMEHSSSSFRLSQLLPVEQQPIPSLSMTPTTTTSTTTTTSAAAAGEESPSPPQLQLKPPPPHMTTERYRWKELPPRTEIDEYDLARPMIEYYYSNYNYNDNDSSSNCKDEPQLQQQQQQFTNNKEQSIPSTAMETLPSQPDILSLSVTKATSPDTETTSSAGATTESSLNLLDLSDDELHQLVDDCGDYPICSQSIIGIKGHVYDTIVTTMQQHANIDFWVQRLATAAAAAASTKNSNTNKRLSKLTHYSSMKGSSSDFFNVTHPKNYHSASTHSLNGPNIFQQQQQQQQSRLHNSNGSLLSYTSSEQTQFRNHIPIEHVYDALDASFLTTTTTPGSPGGGNNNNINSSNTGTSNSPVSTARRRSKSTDNHTTSATKQPININSNTSSIRRTSLPVPSSSSPPQLLSPLENENPMLSLNGSASQHNNAVSSSTTNSGTAAITSNVESANTNRHDGTPSNSKQKEEKNSNSNDGPLTTVVDIPIDLFDVAEYIVMESIKQQYWIPFTQSSQYIKCKHFLWYQDRKVISDDFYILRVLGRGGFGLVTACKKGTSGKLYAMKVMNKRRIKMKRSELLALNERNALAAVESKFVINLKYAFQSSEDIYFILDLMTGGDLGYHLHQRRRFSKRECLYYSARIMLGLQALHDNGYVFRDVKPENCLLAEDGRVKITDLGLATKITPTLCGAAGTRGYWAPEMLQRSKDGKRLSYDHTVDWFSFGCCVAEFISGTNPFRSEAAIKFGKERGKTTKEKMIDCATIEMNPTFPVEIFDSDAADLCRRLLDKDPNTRLGKNGCKEIMAHSWFKSLNWESIISDRKRPPFVPPRDVNAASQSQIGHFAEDKVYQETVLTPIDEQMYHDWDWTNPRAFAAEVIEYWIYERVTGAPLVPMSQTNTCCGCAIS